MWVLLTLLTPSSYKVPSNPANPSKALFFQLGLELRRLRQEGSKFKVSLDYTVRQVQEKTTTKKKQQQQKMMSVTCSHIHLKDTRWGPLVSFLRLLTIKGGTCVSHL